MSLDEFQGQINLLIQSPISSLRVLLNTVLFEAIQNSFGHLEVDFEVPKFKDNRDLSIEHDNLTRWRLNKFLNQFVIGPESLVSFIKLLRLK